MNSKKIYGNILRKPSFERTILLAMLGGLVALMGVSRMDAGAHWASDGIGAYLLGSLWFEKSQSQRLRSPDDTVGYCVYRVLPRNGYF